MKGAVLSGGLITFATGSNTGNADLKNLDLSVPVYAEDGTTQYAFSPMALGDASLGGRTWWKDLEAPTLILIQ